ncbi:MAG TPA: histidine kinase [Thermoleophilaceae bacterium]|nr:histidine kinase [Thermoleophilaceae bacterium]
MGSLARRVVVSSDAERRRLERALHDRAQQRLAALNTTLALARRRVEAGEEGAAELLEQAGEEARLCLEDLRDLARDIFPAVLSERGLASALSDLARRAEVPVEVEAAPEERFPEEVELTAYLLVSQALAGATDDATVSARVEGGLLLVEVRGQGIDAGGTRTEALGGTLDLDDALVRASIPVA